MGEYPAPRRNRSARYPDPGDLRQIPGPGRNPSLSSPPEKGGEAGGKSAHPGTGRSGQPVFSRGFPEGVGYSMITSAAAMISEGIVMPEAFSTFRFTMSLISLFVAISIEEGGVPLRIFRAA